jgi:hypothetical protein
LNRPSLFTISRGYKGPTMPKKKKLGEKDEAQTNLHIEILSYLEKFHFFHADRVNNPKYPDEVKESSQQWIEFEVDLMKALYDSIQNPLFALRGLKCCFDGKINIPKWIQDYFQDAIIGLLNETTTTKKPGEKRAGILEKHFKFKHGRQQTGSSFSDYNKFMDYCKNAALWNGKTEDTISELEAALKKCESKVREQYNKRPHWFPCKPLKPELEHHTAPYREKIERLKKPKKTVDEQKKKIIDTFIKRDK